MQKKNIGILTSVSWNSNKWSAPATEEDIAHSNYDYVKENGWMHEDLNFGHEQLPCEEDGTFIAYTPMFNTLPVSKVDIVFFRSLNYRTKINYIIGFYAFPYIDKYDRFADHDLFSRYDWGNLASLPEYISLFKNPIEVTDEISAKENFLPKGKKLGQRGFNYMFYENVLKVLDRATQLNPNDKKLKLVKLIFLTDNSYKI